MNLRLERAQDRLKMCLAIYERNPNWFNHGLVVDAAIALHDALRGIYANPD